MKDYNEITNSLLERRKEYVLNKEIKRKKIVAVTMSLGCVCLAVLLGIAVFKNPTFESVPPVNTDESAVSNQSNDIILIQKVEGYPTTNERAMFALMLDDFIRMNKEEINEYYGTNIFPVVPSDLSIEDNVWGIFKRNKGTGEIYWDGNHIEYSNEEFTKWLSVNVDKLTLPFDFCNLFHEPETISTINDVKVGLAQTYEGIYYAEFMYKDAGFRIVAEGITQEELISIISSLLK